VSLAVVDASVLVRLRRRLRGASGAARCAGHHVRYEAGGGERCALRLQLDLVRSKCGGSSEFATDESSFSHPIRMAGGARGPTPLPIGTAGKILFVSMSNGRGRTQHAGRAALSSVPGWSRGAGDCLHRQYSTLAVRSRVKRTRSGTRQLVPAGFAFVRRGDTNVKHQLLLVISAVMLMIAAMIGLPPAATAATPPAVTMVSPVRGPAAGGTTVTVLGKHFTAVRRVLFGAVAGTHIHVLSASKLKVSSPARAAGTVHIRVVTAAGKSPKVHTDQFTFDVANPWHADESPSPAEGFSGLFDLDWIGMSCPTAGYCVAVRQFSTGASHLKSVTLSGGKWTTHTISGVTDISAMSCAAKSACFAVGDNKQGPLILRFNGTSWSSLPAPVPGDANPEHYKNTSVDSISCSEASYCVAVGSYETESQEVGLVESWTGSSWTPAAGPAPSDDASTSFLLTNVACARGTTRCAMAGLDGNSAAYLVSRTAATLAPVPVGATGPVDLNSVSCASVCVAVGAYPTTHGQTQGLLETNFSGTTWAAQSAPMAAGKTSPVETSLSSVSCAGAACLAVGAYNTQIGRTGLVETLSGSTWHASAAAHPTPDSSTSLSQVSCTAALACTAVGQYDVFGLADTLSKGKWVAWKTPLPSDKSTSNPDASLNVVSCATATSCATAGTYLNNSGNGEGNLDSR
jgi:hypothetical protein